MCVLLISRRKRISQGHSHSKVSLRPFFLEVTHESLVAEVVRLGGEAGHVGRKAGELGEGFFVEKAEAFGERSGRAERLVGSEDEAPFTKAGDEGVIRLGVEAGGLQGGIDTPEGFSGDEGRGALHDDGGLRAHAAAESLVKGGAVEFAEGEIRWIGEVDDDEIEGATRLAKPDEGVGIFDLHARAGEGVLIVLGEQLVRGKQSRHGGIEIDERDALDPRVAEHLAGSQAIAAAEDENLFGVR